jgi:hypothetical protein
VAPDRGVTMIPGPDAQKINTQLMIFWVIWGAILTGLVVIYVFLGRGPVKPMATTDLPVSLIGLVPLFVSIVIRSLVLPRMHGFQRVLPLFVVGLATAEACGFLGIFLGGPYRESLFVLGVLGVTSYVPLFVRRQLEPKVEGFIPNN